MRDFFLYHFRRRTLCKARWSKFYRNEAWLKQAHQEEAARDEGSASMGLWKRQFQQKEEKLYARHGMFYMPARLRVGEVIGMHWFEPRYRWLASRLDIGTDETMVYCHGRPAVGAESFICVPRQLEIMPDGRAMVELLPVAKCILNELYEEAVPGESWAPKLVCAIAEELPLEDGGDNFWSVGNLLAEALQLRPLLMVVIVAVIAAVMK